MHWPAAGTKALPLGDRLKGHRVDGFAALGPHLARRSAVQVLGRHEEAVTGVVGQSNERDHSDGSVPGVVDDHRPGDLADRAERCGDDLSGPGRDDRVDVNHLGDLEPFDLIAVAVATPPLMQPLFQVGPLLFRLCGSGISERLGREGMDVHRPVRTAVEQC